MSISAKEYKAIAWYLKEKQLKPLLSNPPAMYFKRKDNGEQMVVQLSDIVKEFEQWSEGDAKERLRQRKVKDTGRIIRSAYTR